MRTSHVTCTFCGKPVDTRWAYRKVSGWERGRIGGGTNALALRSPEDTWACHTCIEERKHPEIEGQEHLWG